jgi:hypothetical protein
LTLEKMTPLLKALERNRKQLLNLDPAIHRADGGARFKQGKMTGEP